MPSVCFAAVKPIKHKPKATDDKLRALTSLNQTEYDALLIEFDKQVCKQLACYTLKGVQRLAKGYRESKNSSLFGSKKKLDFILMYLKENPNQAYHGELFKMSQSKVSEWISFLSPVLEECLSKLGYAPQTGYSYLDKNEIDTDCLLVDVTERQVGRREDYRGQEEEYSGKKKLHTVKHLAISSAEGYLLYVSPAFEGSVHDKSIWDQIQLKLSPLNLLADLGFIGIDKDHPNVILPYKKPKKGELTELQKQINKAIGKWRVRIEHAFSGVKRLKIIRNKIRLKFYDVRDRIMRIATALHNLRTMARNL